MALQSLTSDGKAADSSITTSGNEEHKGALSKVEGGVTVSDSSVISLLPYVTSPVCIIHGVNDKLIPIASSQRLARVRTTPLLVILVCFHLLTHTFTHPISYFFHFLYSYLSSHFRVQHQFP